MEESVNAALGQSTDRRGRTTGGVQSVSGFDTYLPVGVSGDDVQAALELGFGGVGELPSTWDLITSFGQSTEGMGSNSDIWEQIGSSVPMLGGEPIPRKYFDNGNIRISSAGNGYYRMDVVMGQGTFLQARDENGNPLTFDLKALVEASK